MFIQRRFQVSTKYLVLGSKAANITHNQVEKEHELTDFRVRSASSNKKYRYNKDMGSPGHKLHILPPQSRHLITNC